MREGEMMQAQDLIVNCQNKRQFANTYIVYGLDAMNTVAEIMAAAKAGDYRFLGMLGVPPHLHTKRMLKAVLRSWVKIVEEKRDFVAGHFTAKWGEPIANYIQGGDTGLFNAAEDAEFLEWERNPDIAQGNPRGARYLALRKKGYSPAQAIAEVQGRTGCLLAVVALALAASASTVAMALGI